MSGSKGMGDGGWVVGDGPTLSSHPSSLIPHPLLTFFVFMLLCGFTWGEVARKVEEGNRLLKEGRYEEALNRYSEAQQKRPQAPEILFNMGNGFYRQKRYKEAIEAYRQSIQPDPSGNGRLEAKAQYNIGSSLYRQGNPEGALEAFKKAVDLDPADIDTKYNIEFIQRRLKQQQKKPQDRQEQRPQQQKEKESGGQKEDQEKESEGGGKEEKDTPEESSEKEKAPPPRGGISEEDAERLLGALQGEEKKLPLILQERQEKSVELPPEKDW